MVISGHETDSLNGVKSRFSMVDLTLVQNGNLIMVRLLLLIVVQRITKMRENITSMTIVMVTVRGHNLQLMKKV